MKKYFLTFLIAVLALTLPALAQSQPTAEQLKPFTGYYRSSTNKDLVVHFQIEHDTLVAKPLWRDLTFHLIPKSELVFHTIEPVEKGPIDIAFFRDSTTGAIAAMSLGNQVRWTRDNNYTPKKEMAHTPDQLKVFEGTYMLSVSNVTLIRLHENNNTLILKQLWDGEEIPLVPETPMDFFGKNAPFFTIHFTKEDNGNINQFVAFGRDTWLRTAKPDLSPAALASAAGKYRSKDDPDNQVSISVQNQTLVVKQLWDGHEIVLQPMTNEYFYNDAKSYGLQLSRKDADGKVDRIVLLNSNIFDRVP